MRLPCPECGHEEGFHATGPDRGECDNCGRIWAMDWLKGHGRAHHGPKLNLIDDGDNHWEGIGSLSREFLSSLMATESHRENMSALQRMNERHAEGLTATEAGGAA